MEREEPQRPRTVIRGHRCNTRMIVDLMATLPSDSVRSYTVSHASAQPTPVICGLHLLDTLLVAFAFVFQLPRLSRFIQKPEGEQTQTISAAVGLPQYLETLFESVLTLDTQFTKKISLLLTCGFLLLVVLRLLHRRFTSVDDETVTAIKGVGIQISKGGKKEQELIDVGTITTLFIHEAFFRHRVVYYLGIVRQDKPQVTVLFEKTLPKLEVLIVVLRGLRRVLYDEAPETGAPIGAVAQMASTKVGGIR